MINNRQKWITLGIFAAIVLACTLLSLFKIKKESTFIYSDVGQLKGKTISGVKTKMPNSSAKIFLDGYFGVSFGSYKPADDFETAITALRNRKVTGIWATDVTAKYLESTGEFTALTPAEAPGLGKERMQFACAFRPTDEALRDKFNEMLDIFEENGITKNLYDYFVNGIDNKSTCGNTASGKTIYVGVTGTVPPLEMVDKDGNVSGMAVELAKYFGAYTDLQVKFVVLDNETAFAKLMSGQVDMIACYGTSENHSTEFPEYIMSKGYCSVYSYCILVNK